MPRRPSGGRPAQPERTRLQVPRAEADQKIAAQISKGEELLAAPIASYQDYERVQHEFFTWNDYCRALLKQLFTTDELHSEFAAGRASVIRAEPSLAVLTSDLHDDIRGDVRGLVSIRARLELYPEPEPPTASQSAPIPGPRQGSTVFIVHGRDDGMKDRVARLVERLHLRAVILHERADGGRTLIEKFEQESSDVGFAVVILTPDDLGALREEAANLRPRARQNVVFELGFFFGKLGRPAVRALVVDEVEIPSDLGGYLYIPVDEAGNWQYRLAREMREAGLPVDLNLV